jgi:hypothetical protein
MTKTLNVATNGGSCKKLSLVTHTSSLTLFLGHSQAGSVRIEYNHKINILSGEGPYNTPLNEKQAYYQTRFLIGARKYYGIEINYIGIWNEKSWTADYVKILRKEMDKYGFENTKIVIGDGNSPTNPI